MNYDLKGKIAVVTGASRGIGLHIARALHRTGASVAITGRNGETLREAAQSIGERCSTFVCDQRDPAAVQRMAERVQQELGAPDLLVNNAALIKFGYINDLTLENWNEVIETNLTGVFTTTRAFLPGMMEKDRADIIMISSMSGKSGDPGGSAYAASKFGLQGFSQSLAREVRKHNIRVMVLNPSSVNTGDDDGPSFGPGLYLHAADLADTVVHLACLPGRTLIRDMDIWGTNP
ncbi:MAG: SDR family NAD(P)-dependent oxidoreductase [bacterium]|nr:SDR family NAD(P)-dependent oxidoreductase [bacterium]